MKYSYLLFLIPFFSPVFLRAQVQLDSTILDTTTIISGLDIPWEIKWGPDDQIWVTERFGRVSRIDPQSGYQDVVLDLSGQVEQSGESGLLGMAFHPNFTDTPYVYLAYTYLVADDLKERIVRFEYGDDTLTGETILLDNIRGSYNHDGCRLVISNDHKLFITTGDALTQSAPQDVDDLSGKVLRINLDGSIPSDNPFPENPVWSFGHRNPQGLLLAGNGYLYSSEHGPDTDDELNIIQHGRNYGWPVVRGFCDQPDEQDFCETNNIVEPLVAWTPTIAPSDIIWYNHPAIPEWQGSILLATLKNKRIYELEMDASGTVILNQKQWFTNYWGRLRDICTGPDGAVYLATNGDSPNNTDPFTHKIIKLWNPDALGMVDRKLNPTEHLAVYPNPVTDIGRVITGKKMAGGQYMIFTSVGKQIEEGNITETELIIKKDRLPAGLYYLLCSKDDHIAVAKILFR